MMHYTSLKTQFLRFRSWRFVVQQIKRGVLLAAVILVSVLVVAYYCRGEIRGCQDVKQEDFFTEEEWPLIGSENTKQRPLPEIHRQEEQFEGYVELTEYWRTMPRASNPQLPRKMTFDDHFILLKLTEIMTYLMEHHNITYIVGQGSLLGSYLQHDVLSWDDDVDLMVAVRDREKLADLLRGDVVKSLDLGAVLDTHHPTHMFKVWLHGRPRAGLCPWTWPFIELSFFDEDEKNVWGIEPRKGVTVPRTSFYPLHRRPLGWLWLPVPKDPRLYLQKFYRKMYCSSHNWDHKEEKSSDVYTVDCDAVVKYYPTVFRSALGHSTYEKLILNGTEVYAFLVDEEMTAQNNKPYSLE